MKSGDKTVYLILTGILSALFAWMFFLMPVCADDIWYLSASTGNPGSMEYFLTTVATCADHWMWDTGRLANMATAPFLALFPRWVFTAVSGAGVWALFLLGPGLCRAGWISLRSAIWILVIVFVLPWLEYLFTVVYCSNYIWAAALGLLFLRLFLRDAPATGIWRIAGLTLLSYIAGWWHEGLSVPMAVALGVYFIVIGKCPSRRQWIMGVALSLGILTILAMPAFRAMTVAREALLIKSTLLETLMNIFVFDCFFYLLAAATLAALVLKKIRRRLLAEKDDFAFVALTLAFGAVATAIYLRYYNGARTGVFAQLICALGLLRLLPVFGKVPAGRWLRWIAFGLAWILSLGSMVQAVRVQTVLVREYHDIEILCAEATRTGKKFIYYDVTPISIGIDFLKPSYMLFNGQYNPHIGRGISMIPSALEGVCLDTPGLVDSRDGRLRLWGNHIIAPGKMPDERVDVMLYLRDGSRLHSRTHLKEYVTECGDTCCVVIPHVMTVSDDLDVADAELIDD